MTKQKKPSRMRSTLRLGFGMYGLIQLAQWISYPSVFKILLQGSSHLWLAPLYVGVLALVRCIASIVLSSRWFVGSRSLFQSVLLISIILTIGQQIFINVGWASAFLIATAFKLGSLTMFQVWRDVLSSQLSRLGVHTSHRANGQFGAIEFGSMAIGVLLGGGISDILGPTTVIWFDALVLCVAAVPLVFFQKNGMFQGLTTTRTKKIGTGFRPFGLIGHGLRSFSDAGFQSILPIIGYKVIHMSTSVFGLAVSISGLMIVVGSKVATLISRKSSHGRSQYAFICLAMTIINAIGLGLCFNAHTSVTFIFWLALASIAGGIVMVATRTILLAEVRGIEGFIHDGAFYFNAIRWLGLGIGALMFAWALHQFITVQTLGFLYLACMVLSGVLLWMGAYERASN